jgi:ribA/ribD-fused uncharacterized protein
MAITRFKDQYLFLSSMQMLEVPLETEDGPAVSVEHAYQASKFIDPEIRKQILAAKNGYKAKRASRRREAEGNLIRPDWHDIREEVMYSLTDEKFARNKRLAGKLLLTGSEPLIEGNTKDAFWGVTPDRPDSQNKLGFILEDIRANLAEAEGIKDVPHSSKPLTDH